MWNPWVGGLFLITFGISVLRGGPIGDIRENNLKNSDTSDDTSADTSDIVRTKRFIAPVGVIEAASNISRIYNDQKNETNVVLWQVYDILEDSFSDTYQNRPQTTTTTTQRPENSTDEIRTTTEKYRISRKELGYILGRNYRGLQKLLNIELNDAFNQSQYSIDEYKREAGNAVAPYGVFNTTPKTLAFFWPFG